MTDSGLYMNPVRDSPRQRRGRPVGIYSGYITGFSTLAELFGV